MYNEKTQYKSLFDVLNTTSTPMGRRLLKSSIAQPLLNINSIKTRYNFINKIRNNYKDIEDKLIGINDIERANRKISLGIINPTDLYNWIQSISNSIELFNYLLLNNLELDGYDIQNILINQNLMLTHIAKYLKIEELQKYF